jgi:dephospho-CoA kinase
MSINIGITGGIGSGKSIVSHLLRTMGIPVYDSDTESKSLVNTDLALRKTLTLLVGEGLYTNGLLNRSVLASYIFTDPKHLQAVNGIIHPAVKADYIRWSKEQADAPIIGIESAILFESGTADLTDEIITVSAPVDIRIRRTMLRDNTSAESIKKRINNQISEEERNKKSDYIIVNDDVTPLLPQVVTVIQSIEKRHSQSRR